jgi:hypothetical protein
MSKSHVLLRYTRLIHLYFGVFISPALIFFAFTGALQTFSLHETTRGSDYKPPQWAVTLGQIHKKQTPVVNKRPPAPGAEAKPRQEGHGDADHGKGDHGGADHEAHDKAPTAATAPSPAPSGPAAVLAKPHNAMPLKIFFLLVSIGLFTSTVTGIYMSYKYVRNRLLVSALLVAGTVIPVLMVLI